MTATHDVYIIPTDHRPSGLQKDIFTKLAGGVSLGGKPNDFLKIALNDYRSSRSPSSSTAADVVGAETLQHVLGAIENSHYLWRCLTLLKIVSPFEISLVQAAEEESEYTTHNPLPGVLKALADYYVWKENRGFEPPHIADFTYRLWILETFGCATPAEACAGHEYLKNWAKNATSNPEYTLSENLSNMELDSYYREIIHMGEKKDSLADALEILVKQYC